MVKKVLFYLKNPFFIRIVFKYLFFDWTLFLDFKKNVSSNLELIILLLIDWLETGMKLTLLDQALKLRFRGGSDCSKSSKSHIFKVGVDFDLFAGVGGSEWKWKFPPILFELFPNSDWLNSKYPFLNVYEMFSWDTRFHNIIISFN